MSVTIAMRKAETDTQKQWREKKNPGIWRHRNLYEAAQANMSELLLIYRFHTHTQVNETSSLSIAWILAILIPILPIGSYSWWFQDFDGQVQAGQVCV